MVEGLQLRQVLAAQLLQVVPEEEADLLLLLADGRAQVLAVSDRGRQLPFQLLHLPNQLPRLRIIHPNSY